MIQINLLDQNTQRGKGRAKAPAAMTPAMGGEKTGQGGGPLVLIVALIMVALNGYVGWCVYAKVAQSRAGLSDLRKNAKATQAKIDSQLKEADQWRHYREVVLNQMDVLRSLDPPNRILWSEKVNMLANLMPSEIFLDRIEVVEETKMVQTEQSKEAHKKWENALDKETRGPEPEKVEKPIITYKMSLTGLATGSDNVQQARNMLKLQDALRNYSVVDQNGQTRRFMDGFLPDIDYGQVKTTLYGRSEEHT
ncbi:MAG: hypothetical protein M1457_08815, partial [bacterium]|nr:hypothetical protein [bacterium]